MPGNAALRLVEGTSPFATSTRKFEALVKKLSGDDILGLRHDALEALIQGDGQELLRQLLQDALDLRTAQETSLEAVEGVDGVKRNHVRDRTRELTTVFGGVDVTRRSYGQRCVESVMPLDAHLNLPADSFSFGVRKQAALAVMNGSFDVATDLLGRQGIRLAKRQVEELAKRAAVDFDAYYAVRDQLAAGDPPASPDGPEFLVISTDAKGITMIPSALRDETKKRAASSTKKLETRLAKGEKPDKKRMAQVAAVYDVKPHVRRVEDVVLLTRRVPDDKRPPPPRATNKRVWASIKKNAVAVIVEAFQEAKRRDPTFSRDWAVLVDGSTDQIDTVKRVAKTLGVEPTIICDIVHVLEYLWKAGHCFEKEGTRELEKWVLQRLHGILKGKASDVAAGIRRSATLRELTGKKRQTVDECARYLLNHKRYLDYPSYMRRGLPISTGVIEGACRHLVKDRMDITGARWGLDGAEAILRIRALYSSGDFDEYWAFHVEQEHLRNHGSRYVDGTPPVVLRPAKYKRGKSHLTLLEGS